jgi:nucleotide-binding universal stress UspA family protein
MQALQTVNKISFKNILFLTDFSEASETALAYTRGLARHFGAQVYPAHACDPVILTETASPDIAGEVEEHARQHLAHLARKNALTGTPLLARGDVNAVVPHWVEEHGIDLIVMGTHGRTASSVANTEAFEWDTATISRFAESCLVFHKNALRIVLRWAQQLQKRFESLSTKTVEQRVADSVVFLAERFRGHTPAEVHLSDEELAQMTGTNLFTVNKILRNWQRLGYVNKSRQRLIILDSVSLCRVSHSSAPSTSCKE